MRFSKKALIATGTGAVVAMAVGGLALAYWTTTGSGTGSATSSNGASDLAIVQTLAPTNLAPGVAAGAITGTVTNNATNNAYVNTVTVSIASVEKAAGAVAGTCDATDYDLTNAVMNVQTDLAPAGSFPFSGASLGFHNKAASQDQCKGAIVHLAYASN